MRVGRYGGVDSAGIYSVGRLAANALLTSEQARSDASNITEQCSLILVAFGMYEVGLGSSRASAWLPARQETNKLAKN